MSIAVGNLYAQLNITSPTNNQVIQRDSAGFATLSVTAYAYFPYSQIKAHLTPVEGNVHKAKEWLFDEDQVRQGFLNTTFHAETGWYQLKLIGSTLLGFQDSIIVARVGVGEVFLVAGNSNAMGLPGLGSKSASSSVISFNAVNKTLNRENITVAPDVPMQIPTFSVLEKDHFIFPGGEASWYWGELGDMLSKRWKTPVLFFNAAWAAANSENYRDAGSGKDAYNLYVGKFWPNRQPYSNIVNTLRYQTSSTGLRAILWSHGENDAQLGFKEEDYFTNIRTLIQNSRTDAGYNVPWLIARNSASNRMKDPYLPVLNAQNRLSEIKNFNVFKGPYLDTIQIPRPPSEHFENITGGIQGLTLAASAWNRSLSDSIVKKLIPHQLEYSIHTGVTPARLFPGATFSLPYRLTGQISGNIFVQAELMDRNGQFVSTAGSGKDNSVQINLPADLPNGTYRIRLTGTNAVNSGTPIPGKVLPGSVSDSFYIDHNHKSIEFVNNIQARLIGTDIHISWLLASNPQLSRMVLQKTIDGYRYSDLQEFESPPSQSQVYGYSDKNLGENAIFYRLKMEYLDGKTTYSTVVTIFQNGGPDELIVFPNPVSEQQFYLNPQMDAPFQYSLFDITGREHPITVSDREVVGLISVRPVYALPAGNYIFRIVNDSEVKTQNVLFR
ncbi:T9SS type A sorting domain-containing protein [Dyadobacter arcticus]|uniref:T9SS type A sorting domain-containing protein n=1 Tax=Dyadobacter arcticus TaxID=1078754 RepID=UPI001E63ABB9|nr:T9SS type A sorting domain-containing protein [Dyadobacter arcticus]